MTQSTNYDQADPDTGPGTVENVAGVEEEDNSAAAAASEVGEAGQEENMGPDFPGDSDDEGTGGNDGASVGSDILGPDGSVTYRTLVYLTGPDWCRVYMTAQGIRAVCGNRGETCTRARHKFKAGNPAHRGPPGWYVGLLHLRRGSAPSLRRDGRLDGPCFSTTEAQDLREQEEVAAAAALVATAGPEAGGQRRLRRGWKHRCPRGHGARSTRHGFAPYLSFKFKQWLTANQEQRRPRRGHGKCARCVGRP
jgi:hypothetical protein